MPETGQAWTIGSKHFVGIRVLGNDSELPDTRSFLGSVGPEVEAWNLGFPQITWENLTGLIY